MCIKVYALATQLMIMEGWHFIGRKEAYILSCQLGKTIKCKAWDLHWAQVLVFGENLTIKLWLSLKKDC